MSQLSLQEAIEEAIREERQKAQEAILEANRKAQKAILDAAEERRKTEEANQKAEEANRKAQEAILEAAEERQKTAEERQKTAAAELEVEGWRNALGHANQSSAGAVSGAGLLRCCGSAWWLAVLNCAFAPVLSCAPAHLRCRFVRAVARIARRGSGLVAVLCRPGMSLSPRDRSPADVGVAWSLYQLWLAQGFLLVGLLPRFAVCLTLSHR